MTKQVDFLFEIGVEELPTHALQPLSGAMQAKLCEFLHACGLNYQMVQSYATPRRLAIQIVALDVEQQIQHIQKRGPAISQAYAQDGKPTAAALGFAKSCGTSIDDLTTLETDKGSWLQFNATIPGKKAITLLTTFLPQMVHSLPINKKMHWASHDKAFVRPIHWLLALLGKEIIPVELWGVKSNRFTHGHRFHHAETIKIEEPKDYLKQLTKTGKLIPCFETRREAIQEQLQQAAQSINANALISTELLTEVTGLVELPVVLTANIQPELLKLPKEVLVTSMKVHQKCFPVVDATGALLPHFLIVSNIESSDPKTVIKGNEKVMHARLQDALFHFETDLKTPLLKQAEKLRNVIYQKKLGSIADKLQRMQPIAIHICNALNWDTAHCQQAVALCKADLMSNMVGEFPELQGTMGCYYALQQKIDPDIATATKGHYLPRFAADVVPQDPLSISIGIADRLDSIVGLFSIGKHPTGDKDPFALRRQAMAICRLCIENKLLLSLSDLLDLSLKNFAHLSHPKALKTQLLTFLFDRLKAWYAEQNVATNTFEAVLATNPDCLFDFHKRLLAVQAFLSLPEAQSLAAANKRVQNILSKNEIIFGNEHALAHLFENTVESLLADSIQIKQQSIRSMLVNREYEAILKSLAELKSPIDQFFDQVMVLCDNPQLRENRLKLLHDARQLFLEVADISLL